MLGGAWEEGTSLEIHVGSLYQLGFISESTAVITKELFSL